MTWLRKKKHFRRPLHIVCPSRWLAECVRDSRLLSHWPVSVIPNPIDICSWKPIDKKLARDLVGLPKDSTLLLFTALGGSSDPRKAWIYFSCTIPHQLKSKFKDLQLVVIGQSKPQSCLGLGFLFTSLVIFMMI